MPKSFLLKRNHVSNDGGNVNVKVETITPAANEDLVIGNNVVVDDEASTDEDDAWQIGKSNYFS